MSLRYETMRDKIIEWMYKQKWLKGHVSFHVPIIGNRVTVFGANAMWFSVNISTKRWGYICFRPPFPPHHFMTWYFYVSPNATPWASTFLLSGYEHGEEEKSQATLRRLSLGHNFNVEENYQELSHINGYSHAD